jgi:hypothetical protein
VFVFKMSEVGPGSGVHLVNRMQPGGFLEHAWIMFDHIKRVKIGPPWLATSMTPLIVES